MSVHRDGHSMQSKSCPCNHETTEYASSVVKCDVTKTILDAAIDIASTKMVNFIDLIP